MTMNNETSSMVVRALRALLLLAVGAFQYKKSDQRSNSDPRAIAR